MQSNTSSRGFASMNPEKQREIARKGGKAAHEKGTAHEFTTDDHIPKMAIATGSLSFTASVLANTSR